MTVVVVAMAMAGGGYWAITQIWQPHVAVREESKSKPADSAQADAKERDPDETADRKQAEAAPVVAAAKLVEYVEAIGEVKLSKAANYAPSTQFGLTGISPKLTVDVAGVEYVVAPSTPSPLVSFVGAEKAELWDLKGGEAIGTPNAGKKIGELNLAAKNVRPLALSPVDRSPYLLGEDLTSKPPQLTVWSFHSGEVAQRLAEAKHAGLADFAEPTQVITVDEDTVEIWDIGNGQRSGGCKLASPPLPNSLALSPSRKQLAYLSASKDAKPAGLLLHVVEVSSGDPTLEYQMPASEQCTYKPTCSDFSANGDELAMWLETVPNEGLLLPFKSRLLTLQMPSGRQRVDIKINDETFLPKYGAAPLRRLEYVSRRGWLLDGIWLLDRDQSKFRWQLPLAASFDGLYALRVIDEKRLITVTAQAAARSKTTSRTFNLETVVVPEANALPDKIALVDPNQTIAERSAQLAAQTAAEAQAQSEVAKAARINYDPQKAAEALEYLKSIGANTKQDLKQANYPIVEVDCKLREINDAGLAKVADLAYLEKLDLTDCSVHDPGIAKLGGMKRLKTLLIGGTEISERCALDLSSLPALETLDVRGTPFSDRALIPLSRTRTLTSLDLSETRVTDTGLKIIDRMPSLKMVDLSGTKVSSAAATELKRKHPDLDVRQ